MQKKAFLIQTLLYHCLIHIDHCVEIRVVHLDPFRAGVNHILIGTRIIIGDYDVKNEVRVGQSLDDAEIMHAVFWIDLIQISFYLCFQGQCLGVIGADGIHVDHSVTV